MNRMYVWAWAFFAGTTLLPALYYCFWELGMETGSARALGTVATFGYGLSWFLYGVLLAEEEQEDDEGMESD